MAPLGNSLSEHAESPARAPILVIDDEEAVRGLFRAILEPIGTRSWRPRTAGIAFDASMSRRPM